MPEYLTKQEAEDALVADVERTAAEFRAADDAWNSDPGIPEVKRMVADANYRWARDALFRFWTEGIW